MNYMDMYEIAAVLYSDETDAAIIAVLDRMDDDAFCDFISILEGQRFESKSEVLTYIDNNGIA